MKKLFTIVSLLASFTVSAQKEPGFLQQQLLGTGVAEGTQLSLDVNPFLFLSNGGGGSASIEFGHWQAGITGFSVVPPDFITETFFQTSDNIQVKRNTAFELLVNYYLRKDRKGVYSGLLGGPEWFVMEDELSGTRETIVKSYVVPRLGIRVFPFKKHFYVDASFGWSFNLSGTETKTLGQSTYNASSGGFIYFFQSGGRFNLSK